MPFPLISPTIPALLKDGSQRYGDQVLLIADGDRLSYAEADRRSADLARCLLAQGVGKGSHVGIFMPNSVEWVVSWFAVTRIGATAVPINTFYKANELGWTARHADLSLIITQPRFLSHDFLQRLEEALPGLGDQKHPGQIEVPAAPYLRTVLVWGQTEKSWASSIGVHGDYELPAVGKDLFNEVETCVTPADALVIIYTSGSSGDPKGTVHTHGSLVRHTYNLTYLYLVNGDDVMFTSMPFFWVGGLITGIHAVVHHGATLVTQAAFEPEEALDLIEAHQATITLGWPQQGKTLAEHPTFTSRDLSSIRRTSMPAMVSPSQRPPAIHSESLGMTELGGNHLGADPYVPQPESKQGTYGPSIDGLEHRIVDPTTGLEVPRGQEGEIAARGYSLMQRLHKIEREDTFTSDGFYLTGDGGYMDDDGWITFTGRLGEMIKTSGGTNVTPGEVEAALTNSPDVSEAYVTGVPDGGTGEIVVAAIVPKRGTNPDAAQLAAWLKQEISAYKVPKYIWVTSKASLPFTDTGKVKKKQLAAAIASKMSVEGEPQ
jgi:acyl-CoA synthetase (AMP-forming)/AMP-acid ligase II